MDLLGSRGSTKSKRFPSPLESSAESFVQWQTKRRNCSSPTENTDGITHAYRNYYGYYGSSKFRLTKNLLKVQGSFCTLSMFQNNALFVVQVKVTSIDN